MRILALVAALALSANAHGQESFEFTAALTDPNSDRRGHGTFTFSENVFTYDVTAPWSFDIGQIRGTGPEGPILFNLSLRRCAPPQGTIQGGCLFQGRLALFNEEVEQLLQGQWYVRTFLEGGPSVQGQIVLVPEPSPFILLAVVIGLMAVVRCGRRRKSFSPRTVPSSNHHHHGAKSCYTPP